MSNRKITIKRVSVKGHDVMELEVNEAITTLKKAMDTDRKWVFVDARKINDSSAIDENLLYAAENVQIANGLVGG